MHCSGVLMHFMDGLQAAQTQPQPATAAKALLHPSPQTLAPQTVAQTQVPHPHTPSPPCLTYQSQSQRQVSNCWAQSQLMQRLLREC